MAGLAQFYKTNRGNLSRAKAWLLRVVLRLALVFCCVLMTGCVDYQLGVTIDSPNSGEMTQHIQLTNQTNPTAQALLKRIQQQTRSVEGTYRALSSKEAVVTIPFHNGKDLEARFNRFFTVDSTQNDLPPIVSNLQVIQGNALLFERDRLVFDIDLSSLGLEGAQNLVDPDKLFNLGLNVNGETWKLLAGQKNHIDTALWLPMPLGWGMLAILGLVVGGTVLRQRSAV
jgi:Protein of unknown function (DUF3153)